MRARVDARLAAADPLDRGGRRARSRGSSSSSISIFVAAVAQVAEPLRHDYSIDGLDPLHAAVRRSSGGRGPATRVFSTRFDTDDVVQRALTLVQMFVVAAMAANAKDALDSRSSAGFAAAYAGVRFVLVAQYFRARHVPEARPLTTRYLVGHGTAAVLWLASALVPAPARFWIWALAFAIDLGTPWLAVPHSVTVPPDAAHLPERFGLFTLILLGESVVARHAGHGEPGGLVAGGRGVAFLGHGASLFLIWWWYFDGAAGASEQPVRTRRDAVRFHVWSYAHFPLSLGIVIVGVGIQRIVTAASRTTLPASDAAILAAPIDDEPDVIDPRPQHRRRLLVHEHGPRRARPARPRDRRGRSSSRRIRCDRWRRR